MDGDVLLKGGFTAYDVCGFPGATLGKDLYCENAHFKKPGSNALDAGGARITGSLVFANGCTVEGTVSIGGTKIGGEVRCEKAALINENRLALFGTDSEIGGSVILTDGVVVKGEIRLQRATIGGDFFAPGSRLENPLDNTLCLEGARIRGSLRLIDKFISHGGLQLIGMSVAGKLDCKGAALTSPSEKDDRPALNADGARIDESVDLSDCRARGEIKLSGTTIGRDLFCTGAEFHRAIANGRKALNCDGASIGGAAILENVSVKGGVTFFAAEMGTYFMWIHVVTDKNTVLNLRSSRVRTFKCDFGHGIGESIGTEKARIPIQVLLGSFIYDRVELEKPTAEGAGNLMLPWLSRDDTGVFVSQPYEQLAVVLRSMGDEAGAREVMIEKNLAKARTPSLSWANWLWLNIFGRLIGYGYSPGRPFLCSLVIVIIGSIVFKIADYKGIMVPTKGKVHRSAVLGKEWKKWFIEHSQRTLDGHASATVTFRPFIYSLEAFIPLLKLDECANWTPLARFIRAYTCIHIIAGWILTTLWIGALTGIAKS